MSFEHEDPPDDLFPVTFKVFDCDQSITIEERIQRNGVTKWAILKHGVLCLTKGGKWEVEPTAQELELMPPDFYSDLYEQARYQTLKEALQTIRKLWPSTSKYDGRAR